MVWPRQPLLAVAGVTAARFLLLVAAEVEAVANHPRRSPAVAAAAAAAAAVAGP